MFSLSKPSIGEYKPFYQGYVEKAEDLSSSAQLIGQADELRSLVQNIDPLCIDKPLAVGKWTLNQTVGHILDTEKIMHYRALAIARDPGIELVGFDQDVYVEAAQFKGSETFYDSLEAIFLNRKLLSLFLKDLDVDMIRREGLVDGHPMTVRALVYIIYGHMQHHLGLLKGYLK